MSAPGAPNPRRVARLAWRSLRREWRSGELRVLAAAIVVAVASLTAVGVFTDRMERAMVNGAAELLGADAAVVGSDPPPESLAREAQARGLRVAHTAAFRSVLVAGDRFQLAEVKAVDGGYPLRGKLRVAPAPYAADAPTDRLPAAGEVWVEARLMGALGLDVGDRIEIGERAFTVSAVLTYEPDRGGDVFSIAPRVLMRLADVGSTGLVRAGSRVKHRLLVAGDEDAVRGFRAWAAPRLDPGLDLQGVRDARPEIRAALDHAGRFLGLAALVSVLLAGVAIAVTSRRHAVRHLDAVAVMRCLGAGQATVVAIHAIEIGMLGVVASLAGAALGYAGQAGLAALVGSMLLASLPPPSALPVAAALATGLVMLLGFAMPPLMRLRHVPPVRVLRRESGPLPAAAVGAYAAALAAFAGLVLWQANDLVLAGWVLGGVAATVAALLVVAMALVAGLNRLRGRVGVSWRFGIANIARRATSSVVQVAAFGLGIMVLLLLTLVRDDLLADWRANLPPDTPNYFLVNVQPDEVEAVRDFLRERGLVEAALHPIVRSRLVARNGHPVKPEDYREPRAQRLAAHEFNLSWSARVPEGNHVVAGAWWPPDRTGMPRISVEEGLARTLGFALGDRLTFLVAGEPVEAVVDNLRSVEWDSFRVNFFVLFPPGVIDDRPATYITSVHVPPGQRTLLLDLVRAHPSVTVLDIDALLGKVREIMEQASLGVEYVFVFTLVAGFTVLLAAVQATLDERRYETAMVRALGADRARVVRGLLAEFLTLGVLAGLLGAIAATALGAVLATQVFDLAYRPDPWVWIAGVTGGGIGVGVAGFLGTRAVLEHPPLRTLRGA